LEAPVIAMIYIIRTHKHIKISISQQ